MKYLNAEELNFAVDALYEAAALPELWATALVKFATALGGFGGTIVNIPNDGDGWFHASSDFAEPARAYITEGWGPKNFRITLGMNRVQKGAMFVREQMLLAESAIDRQPVQTEFFRKYGMRSFLGFEFVPGFIGGSVERGNRPFEDWEVNILEKVHHHFRRIGSLATARGAGISWGAGESLQKIRRAAVLLDHRGLIVEMNEMARGLISSAFFVRSGALVPQDTEVLSEFALLVQGVVRAPTMHEIRSNNFVVLRRPLGSPLIASVVPISGAASDIFQRAKAILLLMPMGQHGQAQQALRNVFHLTPAEARLADLMGEGDDLAAASVKLGVATSTLRTHLKSIFQKTGTSRQADLVALITRLNAFV